MELSKVLRKNGGLFIFSCIFFASILIYLGHLRISRLSHRTWFLQFQAVCLCFSILSFPLRLWLPWEIHFCLYHSGGYKWRPCRKHYKYCLKSGLPRDAEHSLPGALRCGDATVPNSSRALCGPLPFYDPPKQCLWAGKRREMLSLPGHTTKRTVCENLRLNRQAWEAVPPLFRLSALKWGQWRPGTMWQSVALVLVGLLAR